MSDWYVLIDRKPVALSVQDSSQWRDGGWRVGLDTVEGVKVSTVFLGLDHRFGDGGRPVLFETHVFGGAYDGCGDRYCTWEEAEAGHDKWVAKVQAPPFFWLGADAIPEAR